MSLDTCWVQRPGRRAAIEAKSAPRGEAIPEEMRPSAASGEEYLLTTYGPIRVGRRTAQPSMPPERSDLDNLGLSTLYEGNDLVALALRNLESVEGGIEVSYEGRPIARADPHALV